MTIDILKNSSDSITIGSKQFAVRSYKIEHSKNTAKQFTVSGNTKLVSKGINPVILIIDSDSKFNDSTVIPVLETALSSASQNNFQISGLAFADMILYGYSAEKDKNGFICNISMTFMSLSAIEELTADE